MKHRPRFQILDRLLNEQWLSREETEALQLRRLQELLQFAGRQSPYYRTLFAEHGIDVRDIRALADLRRIPLLTRMDLQQHGSRIRASTAPDVYRNASGGSTGQPVVVYQDSRYREFGEALYLLFLSWAGVSVGDRTAIFWGSDRDLSALSLREKLMSRIYRLRVHNSFHSSAQALDRFLRQLEIWKPQFIYGYASSLDAAARRVSELEIQTIRPRAVRSSAELLSPAQRKRIASAFDAPVFDFYGSREVNNIAAQCEAREGLHVMMPGRVVEIVDAERPGAPADGMGELAVTDLTNFTFPLIRYLNGDRARLAGENCSCGRAWPCLSELGGRTTDTLRFGSQAVHGEFFTHLFYDLQDVQQFQVVQDGPMHLTIRVKATGPFRSGSLLKSRIAGHLGEGVEVAVEEVTEIETTSSGKQKFVLNQWSGADS